MSGEFKEIIASIKKHIELEGLAGTAEFIRWPDPAQTQIRKGNLTPAEAEKRSVLPEKKIPAASLLSLKEEVLLCTRCDLFKTRTHVVFGAGSPRAKLMFVGEAPGMQEDLRGIPFVGRAGELLTKIIESMGLKRKDVYIANVLKCRPPNNRNPLPTEILTCEGYLIKQIELIKPKIICALGKFAAQTLLRSQEPITRLRGEFYDYHGVKIIPTFHPAYLLRNPHGKKQVWEDMKKIRKELKGS